jgi:hypothetical protein
MRKALVGIIAATALLLASSARAQEACKTVSLKKPAISLAEVYAMADKAAKAWKADAVPARITNTVMGPLQPDGSSKAWNLMFYSKSANANVSINTMNGSFTCWAMAGPAGRIPDLKPDFFRDGSALYALAKSNGEALIQDGYTVSLGTAAAPDTSHATWYIGYEKDNKNAKLTVIVDANTGKVEKVLKD